MSTSSKWPDPVHAFEYPSVLGASGVPSQRRTEDEAAAHDARIRELSVRETETRLRADLDQAVADERRQIAVAVAGFTGECESYYRRIEAEVVQLSLAIARRILHREAEVDPMMLAGVVRVALDNLRAATEIKLHVCPAHAAAWRATFEDPTGTSCQVKVIDEQLFSPAQCRLESNLGAVELGVDDQLKEIEQGFFDLLAARPR